MASEPLVFKMTAIRDFDDSSRLEPVEWMTLDIPADPIRAADSARAMVEFRRNFGPANMAACVGGTFTPAEDGRFRVSLAHTGKWARVGHAFREGSLFGSSLITGLPEEFARGALAGVVDCLTTLRVGSGTLTVDVAAFDPIDTSPMSCRFGAGLLMRALFVPQQSTGSAAEALHGDLSKWIGQGYIS